MGKHRTKNNRCSIRLGKLTVFTVYSASHIWTGTCVCCIVICLDTGTTMLTGVTLAWETTQLQIYQTM